MGLSDPVVLFFLLGFAASLLKSELKLPASLYETLSILLLLAIGLKGGVELAKQASLALLGQSVAVLAMGVILPLLAFPVLRVFGFVRADAASLVAHYGSVSVGTFAVAVAFLAAQGVSFEEYLPLFVVVLEVPAILVGIVLAKGISRETDWKALGHELFLGKSIVLLIGGLLIGWIAGPTGVKPLEPLFFTLFKPLLGLFLLEMGLIAASQLGTLKRYGVPLVIFAVVMPLLSSVVGALLGMALGLSVGGVAMLATLAASASYIAVPAAMRMAVPEANPSLSLTASLGITFPFNIVIGIPLYLQLAQWLAANL